ncbi:unnamed protein product [Prorocentrum cordatum]|uniref:Uncharacterized protein n=1 Tax=Prorocentrum cordatum TaxID=2364126 RepID=A0ABN9XCL3_9DINO|nr:unnamed protein product [Polarella glacialis]
MQPCALLGGVGGVVRVHALDGPGVALGRWRRRSNKTLLLLPCLASRGNSRRTRSNASTCEAPVASATSSRSSPKQTFTTCSSSPKSSHAVGASRSSKPSASSRKGGSRHRASLELHLPGVWPVH